MEQLQARLQRSSSTTTTTERKKPDADDEYSECYPSTYELGSFYDFRASDKSDKDGKSSSLSSRSKESKETVDSKQPDKRHHHKQSRDEKIARDLNKLEQWKRNAQEREAKGVASSSTRIAAPSDYDLPTKKPRTG